MPDNRWKLSGGSDRFMPMFSLDLAGLDADAALALAGDVDAAADRAGAPRPQVALRGAALHGALAPRDTADAACRRGPALRGAERLVRLGGDGPPPVAEFAPAELA